MNKIYKSFLLFGVFLTLISCSKDDKFSGSPIGNVDIVELNATITTTTTNALSGQDVDVTITLPDNKTFQDTVSVEVTALRQNGVGRTRSYLEIMPGQNSVTGIADAVGGEFFTGKFTMSVTAINLQTVEAGKHYLIRSNPVEVNTGDTALLSTQADRLKIGFAWPNPIVGNSIKVSIDRPTLADVSIFNITSDFGRVHSIFNEGTTNTGVISSAPGDYIFSIGGDGPGSLLVQGQDLPYRLVIRFPDAKVLIFEGVYQGFTTSSPLIPVLKVTKTEVPDGVPIFTVVRL